MKISRLALSFALFTVGCALVLNATATAHHANFTHNSPEAILTGLENADLPNKVVKNNGTDFYLVTSDTDILDGSLDQVLINWNNGLRDNGPNNLTKFPFNKNAHDDPAANVRVIGYSNVSPTWEYDDRCFTDGSHACLQDDLVDDNDSSLNILAPTLYIIVNLAAVTTDAHERGDIAHELGHLLFFNEHYINLSTGNPAYDSVMDLYESDGRDSPQPHDRQDFFDAYKPQTAPNASTMSMSGSSSVTLNWSNASQHNIARFYFNRQPDTSGGFTDDGYTTDKATTSKTYNSVADNHRFCAKANGVSDAGFQVANIFSPRTFFGCWTRKTGAAGRFLATSHRAFGSELRVKNLSGGTRNIAIFGPALQNIGCATVATNNNSTYSCSASVSIGQYNDLLIVMTNTAGGAQTLAALDFD